MLPYSTYSYGPSIPHWAGSVDGNHCLGGKLWYRLYQGNKKRYYEH
ncbi:unnamed protein product [marine sediment metagenome]|uniref:Uncharacterized protein n=1 Tax=marine sediment metagenome TaxID=412755 RepID=X1U7Y5_9ZZZZ